MNRYVHYWSRLDVNTLIELPGNKVMTKQPRDYSKFCFLKNESVRNYVQYEKSAKKNFASTILQKSTNFWIAADFILQL